MTKRQIENRVNEIIRLKNEIKELENQVDSLQNQIKTSMETDNLDELDTGKHIVRWKYETRNSFDTSAFKKLNPDTYKMWLKVTSFRKFTIN